MDLNPKCRTREVYLRQREFRTPNLKDKVRSTDSPWAPIESESSVSFMVEGEHKDISIYFTNGDTVQRIPGS